LAAIHPGEAIREDFLKPLGLTVTTLPIDPESLVRRGGD